MLPSLYPFTSTLLSCQISRRQLDGYTMYPLYLSLLEQQIIQKDAATQPYLVHVDTCRYWYIQNPSYSPFLTECIFFEGGIGFVRKGE